MDRQIVMRLVIFQLPKRLRTKAGIWICLFVWEAMRDEGTKEEGKGQTLYCIQSLMWGQIPGPEIMTWTKGRCITDWATEVPQADLNSVRIGSWFLVKHLPLFAVGLTPAHGWKHLKLILMETDYGFVESLSSQECFLLDSCLLRWCWLPSPNTLPRFQLSALSLLSSWFSISMLSDSCWILDQQDWPLVLVYIFLLALGSILITSGSRSIPPHFLFSFPTFVFLGLPELFTAILGPQINSEEELTTKTVEKQNYSK